VKTGIYGAGFQPLWFSALYSWGSLKMLVSYPPLALKVLFRSFTDSKALRSLRKGKGRKGKGNSKGKATAKADPPPAAKDDNQKTRATAKARNGSSCFRQSGGCRGATTSREVVVTATTRQAVVIW
jgi:hypothetical protein